MKLSSMNKVKALLAKNGCMTKNDKEYSIQALIDILSNDFYTGIVRHGDLKKKVDIFCYFIFCNVNYILSRITRPLCCNPEFYKINGGNSFNYYRHVFFYILKVRCLINFSILIKNLCSLL